VQPEGADNIANTTVATITKNTFFIFSTSCFLYKFF